MTAEEMTRATDRIRRLMAERLHVRGRDLATQVRRAGRLLPRPVRREARFLVQAEPMLQHPRLARMVDPDQVARAVSRVVAHLESVDPAARARARILGIASGLAFHLLWIGGAAIGVLAWRGVI